MHKSKTLMDFGGLSTFDIFFLRESHESGNCERILTRPEIFFGCKYVWPEKERKERQKRKERNKCFGR